MKDFDPSTGKLIHMTSPEPVVAPKEPAPAMANPLKLAPTGSPQGRLAMADVFRALLTLFASLGGLGTILQVVDYVGSHPFTQANALIWAASFAAFVSHLILARQANNTGAAPRMP